ncbi:M64 family metallopeptidase [Melioribacteraceae bacterium 4301-Me]|uniref:M64 family metallopeptidase n=1 Tax=Pyranulibacter aquaticus TaxID=3163344 RepID=UPI003597A4E6
MKRLFIVFLFATSVYAQIEFNKYFLPKTLRLDYYHNGDKNTEVVSFDKLIEEPYWGGSYKNLVDTLKYGNYYLHVYDDSTGTEIYSRGFSDLFQEWQTTEEAKHVFRSMQGSVVMPFPKNKIRIQIDRRNRKNIFEKKFEYTVDPKSYFIIKEQKVKYPSFRVLYSGLSEKKLDIVIVPEGYTKEEMSKFKEDCKKFVGYLFSYSPFKEFKNKFNIWGIEAPSIEDGTDIPGENVWKNTLLNSHFYTFGSERYLMTTDYFLVRDVASNAPYDQIFILVNTSKYGGGAVYNYYTLSAIDNRLSKQIIVHEFGHGLAGLADEYGNDNTYQDMYPTDVEPWEPNLTTLVNFSSKWEKLIKPGTPIPTPPTEKYKNTIGVFEGGGYVEKGVYRPTLNSIMNSFSSNEFNEVCKLAIIKIIDFYTN